MVEILALISAGLCLVGIVIAVVTSELLKRQKPAEEHAVKRRAVKVGKKKLEGDPAEAAAAAFRALSQKTG